MVLWDHKLGAPVRRAAGPRGGAWLVVLAASVPPARAWLLARLKARRAELKRRIARELAGPRPDLGSLGRMRRRIETTQGLLAALVRDGGRPGAALPADRGVPPGDAGP